MLNYQRPGAIASVLLAMSVWAACGEDQTEPQVVEPLAVEPDAVTVTHIGERFAFAVRGAGADEVRWRSADTTVFVVDQKGTVTARGNGAAHLAAFHPPKVARALVEVRQAPAAIEPFGSGQRAAAALSLLEPAGVRVLDAGGTPAAGVRVFFETEDEGGRAEPEWTTTDSLGMASTVWTLGRAAGRQTLRAAAEDGEVSTEIWATAIEPDDAVASIAVLSGQDQWVLRGRALPEPVVARVLDEARRPVWGATVRFEPGEGSGRVGPSVAMSDSLGLASAVWTLGNQLGRQRLVAVARGTPVEFRATAVSDEGVCNRTPAVSAEIARRVWVGSCAEVTETSLGRVDGLFLGGKNIRRLTSGDFDGLVSLRLLYLDRNRLSELPPDIFRRLAGLEVLSMTRNELRALPPGIFDGLAALKWLSLEANELAELRPGVFDGLAALERLSLVVNELAELRPGTFDGLAALESLGLSVNGLSALPPGIFSGLTSLTNLYLLRNSLTELPAGVLSDLPSLRFLNVGGNQLSALRRDLFDGLSGLKDLLLHENNLRSLPPGLLAETPALTWIDLSDNQLRELPPGLFSETRALNRLELGGNRLRALPEGVFDDLADLRRLNLDRNRVEALPEGVFDGLAELGRLNLDVNRLAELPEGVFDGTPELAELGLTWNGLRELPRGMFAGLSRLQIVDVAS